MRSPVLFHRAEHDPWYDLEGVGARARRRRKQLLSAIALAISLVALFAVALAWTSLLGVDLLGLHVPFAAAP